MNWLNTLVNQHSELESPISFWYWAGLSSISAVVKDQVWLHRQIYNLYPNIYVMLHADSGLKKGPPVSMAKQLVTKVNNTQIISGRSSIQGILKQMGGGETLPGGKIKTKSQVFICSSELSSSIVDDPVATKILTDLYDRQYNIGEWKSLLKMETFNLKDPTVTMLTATNEAMSDEFFTNSSIQGGYIARTFIIYESKRNKPNSLIWPLTNAPNYNTSADYLKEIAKLQGPFEPLAVLEENDVYKYKKMKEGREIFFNEPGIVYDDWYDNFLEQVDAQEVKDETGTLNRFGDSVLKIAMLLSLADKPELILSAECMHNAIQACEKLVGNIRKTTVGKKGMSQTAALKSLIINELLTRDTHSVSKAVLMKKMWMHYGTENEFDEMMNSFEGSGIIKTESRGNQVIYAMPEAHVKELKEFFAGKLQRKNK